MGVPVKETSWKGRILTIIIWILVLAAIGVGCYYLWTLVLKDMFLIEVPIDEETVKEEKFDPVISTTLKNVGKFDDQDQGGYAKALEEGEVEVKIEHPPESDVIIFIYSRFEDDWYQAMNDLACEDSTDEPPALLCTMKLAVLLKKPYELIYGDQI